MAKEVLELSGVDRIWAYVKEMQESRASFLEADRQERLKQLQTTKLARAQRKKLLDAFLRTQQKPIPWKFGERANPELLSPSSYLPNRDIHARELYKVTHLVPRSYQYPTTPVKLTKNTGEFFGKPPPTLLTKSGQAFLDKNSKSFEANAEKLRQAELELKKSKLSPRWLCTSHYGGPFDAYPTDYVHYKQQNHGKYTETKPFLRTSRYGTEFSYP